MLGTRRREAERRQRTPLREMGGRVAVRQVASREVEQRTVVVRSEKEKRPLARVLHGVPSRRLARGVAAAPHRARRCARFFSEARDARTASNTHTRNTATYRDGWAGAEHMRAQAGGERRGAPRQRGAAAGQGAAPSRRVVQSS